MPDIQNPQHEPGSEKRLMLVFLLTFIVMLAFQPLLKKYFPQPVTPQQQSQAAATSECEHRGTRNGCAKRYNHDPLPPRELPNRQRARLRP